MVRHRRVIFLVIISLSGYKIQEATLAGVICQAKAMQLIVNNYCNFSKTIQPQKSSKKRENYGCIE